MAGSLWWVPDQPVNNFPGGVTYGGGGWNYVQKTSGAVAYRSPLDAARAARGTLPHAEYPDGYLGTIIDRHEDKLLDAVQQRLTQRSYQRGVHKGEKIARTDYLWDTNAVDPMGRIKEQSRAPKVRYEATTMVRVPRYAPTGNPVEKLAHMGKTAGLSPPEQVDMYKRYGVSMAKNPIVIQDPHRKERMSRMLPPWVAVGMS